MENEKLNTLEQLYKPSSSSSPSSPGGGFKIIIFIIVAILILAGAAFAASKYFNVKIPFLSKEKESEEFNFTPTPTEVSPTETPTPTKEATPSPTLKVSPATKTTTPTPKPTTSADSVDKTTGLDRSKLTVAVLNGSGVAGAGKKAADILSGLGYKVVSTGNADNYDYANTVIEVKSASKDYLTLLKKDLGGSYVIGTTSAVLSTGTSADAQVIVGKE